MKSPRRRTEPSAIEMIEEAVHLLRRAPVGALAFYYAGAVPFVLALLFFWARATWFHSSDDSVAGEALLLAVLFAFMKVMQAEFCARLLALESRGAPPAWSWRRFLRLGEAQVRLQPWALAAVVASVVLAFPFGWTYAYAQVVTVIGDDERLHGAAVEEAKRWPMQNHLGLGLLAILGLFLWVNVAAAFVAVPWLANRLLGIENIFGFSGWWFLNTTFLASVTALTWLAVDPLVKAFYSLWVFHGRSRRSGEDLRVEFRRAARLPVAKVAAVALALLVLVPATPLRCAETAARPAVQAEQLDRALDDVLGGSDFAWRMRIRPAPKPENTADGPVARSMAKVATMIRDALRAVGHQVRRLIDWIARRFFSGARDSTGTSGAAAATVRFLLYVLIGGAGLLLLWLVWIVVQQVRRTALPVLRAEAVATTAPDLRDENVHAGQLPADGWLALARNEAARGEWRLALRALYLATLARSAAEGLITLAKYKTNLDYERELGRRALSRTDIVTRFSGHRRRFDGVWYGRDAASETDVQAWLAEFEQTGPS